MAGVKKQKVNSKGKVVIKGKKAEEKGEKLTEKSEILTEKEQKPKKAKIVIQKEASQSESESEREEEQSSESEESGIEDLANFKPEQLEELEELDDEMDVEDVSDNDNDSSSSDEELNSDGEYPKLKKKKNLDDGSSSFASALNAIVGSKLKAYDRKDPILARNKVTLKKLESDKLESKAKKALLTEKKELHDKHRIKNILPSTIGPLELSEMLEKERKLKKIAQKGVVRLFNAVLSTQVKTNEAIQQEKVGDTRKEELFNEISKEKFLDLVQAAGDE